MPLPPASLRDPAHRAAASSAGATAAPDRVWDAIIIGTGMGGATLGHALARRGRSVLFVEKGERLHVAPDPQARKTGLDGPDDPESRLRRGMWPVVLNGTTSFGAVEFFAPLGCGTGGSSTLYAGQLERMRPVDFTPRAVHGDDTGANLPDAWPVAYATSSRPDAVLAGARPCRIALRR